MGTKSYKLKGLREELTDEAIKRLEAIASQQGSPELSAVAANMKSGHISEAEPVFRSIAETYASVDGISTDLQVKAFIDLAVVKMREDADEALAVLEKARALSPNDPVLLAFCGYLLFQQGDHKQSEDLFARIISLEETDDNTRWRAIAFENIGVIKHMGGNLKSAASCYDAAIKGFRRLGDEQRLAEVMSNRGLIDRRAGRYEEALQSFTDALAIWKQLENDPYIVRALGYVASVHFLKQEFDLAAEAFLERAQFNELLDDVSEMAADNANLGLVFIKQQKRDIACGHWREARKLYRSLEKDNELNALDNLLAEYGCTD
jgi:tetratricopeptide (TPR) repeat protein